MGEKIQKYIEKIKKDLDCKEILAIIYNPYKEAGIQRADVKFLYYILEQVKFNYPIILLFGHGGNFEPGILLPICLKKFLKKYRVFVPKICGSALCYTIFKANKLIVTNNTQITQMDPKMPYKDEELRAIKHLTSKNKELKIYAKKVFNIAKDNIMKLLKPPSVVKYEIYEYNELEQMKNIVQLFMQGPKHESIITYKHLKEAEIKVELKESEELKKYTNKLINKSLKIMEQGETRVMFISSKQFVIPDEKGTKSEGTYLCPLK